MDSSNSRAVIVTVFVDLGMAGEWITSKIMGAMLDCSVELVRPGVPLTVTLGAQFWPFLLERTGFMSSADFPSPS